ncbi:MAG TPA: hypothetical protein VJ725_29760 [Thermoanaerobaculia bacterium]|nr:hypothetical protein [Thermoanaerobaculia bacterium]
MRYRIPLFAVLLVWTLAAAAQEAPTPTPRPPAGREQMFHITLLFASSGAPAQNEAQDLPKSVQKAIADLRDFLPFKSYRTIDSALVRLNGRGRVPLNGPNGERYSASLEYHELDTKGSFLVDQFALTLQPEAKPDGHHLQPGHAPKAPEQPIVSSFRIARGESVVVGSSGLGVGKALIIVLTAVP